MNKTTLLAVGLVATSAIAYSYVFLTKGDISTEQQLVENIQGQLKESPVPLKLNGRDITNEQKSEEETTVVDQNSYARALPPPPIQSNKTKDGRYTTPKAHGHEEVHGEHKENAPPPPTGAN